MHSETLTLLPAAPGTAWSLPVWRFGTPGTGPKAYIQAALHADEVPAMLVAQQLRAQLELLERQGLLTGEVVLVPSANPIGLAQVVSGQHHGRFDLRDGTNFNRAFAEVAALAAPHLGWLGPDAAANVRTARAALRQAVAGLPADTPAQHLKRQLLGLAIDADVVLDLHCDSDAVMHLYALSPQAEQAAELGALLGAEAILLATESGGGPFDEACSRPWLLLQAQHPGTPIPLGCFAATVELRGECDTSHALAAQDAAALVAFLRLRGIVGGSQSPLPAARCEPTPLSGSEPLTAPCAGVVVFHAEPGEHVAAGDVVADITDPHTGTVTAVAAQSAGVLYARGAGRWAWPGKRLGKIAGRTLARSGTLLSP